MIPRNRNKVNTIKAKIRRKIFNTWIKFQAKHLAGLFETKNGLFIK